MFQNVAYRPTVYRTGVYRVMSNVSFINLGTCEDDTQYAASCPYWAGIGECSNNPAFMLVFCKKSCLETCEDGKFFICLMVKNFDPVVLSALSIGF